MWRFIKMLFAIGSCGLYGCAYYQVHIKAVPQSDYDIVFNGKYQGKLPSSGDTTLELPPVSMLKGQVLEIRKDSAYGKIKFDYNGVTSEKKNVGTVNSHLGNIIYYDILFILDPRYSQENRELFHQKLIIAELDSSLYDRKTINYDTNASDTTSIAQQPIMSCDSSFHLGFLNAKTSYNPGGWVAIGFGAGFAWAFIGTGLTVSMAACSKPSPDSMPAYVNRECFSKGYAKKARKKRVIGTIFGNLGGIAAVVGFILIMIATNP